MNDDWDDFYEDDEPLGKILAAWNAAVAEGRTGKTASAAKPSSTS